jgi:predicted SprT family Zn-dependent metalloprotease
MTISFGHMISDIERRHNTVVGKKFDYTCWNCGHHMIKIGRARGSNLGNLYKCIKCDTIHHVLPWEE